MQISKLTKDIYLVQGYQGYLSGTKIQALLYGQYQLRFPVEEWEITIDTVTIGPDRRSNATIMRRKLPWTSK